MILATEHLTIRPFIRSDLRQFRQLLEMPEVPGWQMQRDRAEAFLDWHISNYTEMDILHGIVCFGVFDSRDGRIVGATGAGEHDDLHEPEIFYNILPGARGKGYATEAAEAIVGWVFSELDVEYLIGTAGIDNVASQRVLEKCGFQFVETRELLVHTQGQRHEFKCYRLKNPKQSTRLLQCHGEELLTQ